jgi:hypothetical protein
VLLAVASVTCLELAASAQDATTNIDIGTNEIGAPPAEFDLLPSGDGKQGQWTVVHDATAKTGIAIEQAGVQTTEDRKHREPYESRGSRTVLGAPEGETPSGDTSFPVATMTKGAHRSTIGPDRIFAGHPD